MEIIKLPNGTVIVNGEAIGLTITAHTIVFNGDAKNTIVEQANDVTFNKESNGTTIESAVNVIDNKQTFIETPKGSIEVYTREEISKLCNLLRVSNDWKATFDKWIETKSKT